MNSLLRSSPIFRLLLIEPLRKLWGSKRAIFKSIPIQRVPVIGKWNRRPEHYVERASDLSKNVVNVIQAGSKNRVLPRGINGQVKRSDRSNTEIAWDLRYVPLLENARVVGGYGAAVISSQNQLIGDLSPDVFGSQNHELFGRVLFPQQRHLNGRSLLLATPEAENNFGHWLFDLLPRVLAVEKAGYSLKNFDHIILNSCNLGYQKDSLECCGLPIAKIRMIDRNTEFLCDTLVTTNVRQRHWQHSLPVEEQTAVADRITRNAQKCATPPSRIWLSRKDASFRRTTNEDELLPILKKYGFETLNPEKFSLQEQAFIFGQAEAVAGPHTSAMCNWMFCKRNTPVLEVMSPWHEDYSFWTNAGNANLRYYQIYGIRESKVELKYGTRFVDYAISPEELDKALAQLVRDIHN